MLATCRKNTNRFCSKNAIYQVAIVSAVPHSYH